MKLHSFAYLILHAFVALEFVALQVSALSAKPQYKVVVTGASNSVGYLVFKRLLKSKTFLPVGLVRDKKGYRELKKLGADDNQIKIGDITKRDTLHGVFNDAKKVILCTTAQPKKKFWFNIISFLLRFIGKDRPPKTSDLYYPKNESPYHVDFVGQKNVVDACLDAKVDHIIMLGNMGGYRGSKLNDIGRDDGNEQGGGRGEIDPPHKGNLLKWKRAAERYLMKRCFLLLSFIVVH